MQIEISDPKLEARIRKQIHSTGASSVEEHLLRLLETQEEQERWVSEGREAIQFKIRLGLDQLQHGEEYRRTSWTAIWQN
jgi:hypothetical protein